MLFGAISLRTGHRVVVARPRATGADGRVFLHEVRRHYRGWRTLWLLADRASAHADRQTQASAAQLDIRFVWLPKQTPELNAMDQLWRALKEVIAANRQAANIVAPATSAMLWVLKLSPTDARPKAGMLSPHFWLGGL